MKTFGNQKKLDELIKQQNGTVLSSDLNKYEIPRTYLSLMVADGQLERVGRGVYALPDAVEDVMFAMQGKYPKLIYSHETALYLHGMSDRTLFEYSATVPSGYKVVKTITDKFKIYFIKKDLHLLGVTKTKTSFGNTVTVYSLERTICDVLRSKNRIDIQIFSEALKRVANNKSLDFQLLMETARELGVEKTLRNYLEVLM